MGYITNPVDQEYASGTPDNDFFPQTYLLPKWIFEAFTAKYNLVDLHNYGKLREVLSLEDLAQQESLSCYFNNWLQVSANETSYALELGTDTYSSWDGSLISLVRPKTWGVSISEQPALTDQQYLEVKNTVLPMSLLPSVRKEIVARLTGLKNEQSLSVVSEIVSPSQKGEDFLNSHHGKKPDPTDLKEVQVVTQGNSLYIVVEEGFLALLDDTSSKLAFFRQVLKSAYAVAPLRIVNRSVWYKQYLKALKA